MPDPIKDRIRKNLCVLRESRKLTQDELADQLGSTQKSISSYERNRAFPPLDVLDAYLRLFNISYEDLSTKDLSQMSEEELNRLLRKNKNGESVLTITVDHEGNENIELVPIKAAAGYASGYGDPDFLKSLPRFRLPFVPAGTYRAFEIKGNSMLPVEPGDIVVGKYVESPEDIRKGDAYILVTEEDGIVFKRVFDPADKQVNGKFLLVSDNPEYSPYEVNVSDIQQIWKAYKIISNA